MLLQVEFSRLINLEQDFSSMNLIAWSVFVGLEFHPVYCNFYFGHRHAVSCCKNETGQFNFSACYSAKCHQYCSPYFLRSKSEKVPRTVDPCITIPGGATLIDFSLIASFIGAGSLLPLALRYSWRAAVGSRGRPLGPKVIANLTVTFALGLKKAFRFC